MSGPDSLVGKHRKPMPLTAKIEGISKTEVPVSEKINQDEQLENKDGGIDQEVETLIQSQEESSQ